jgi:hypothetical protein
MKKLNITDLKDKEIIYIIPLDDGSRELNRVACWGTVDMIQYRIKTDAGSYPIGSMGNGYGYNAYDSPKRISDQPLTVEQIKQEKLVWAIQINKDGEELHQSWGIWCEVKQDRLESCNDTREIKLVKYKVDGYNVYLAPPKPKELII